jgi:glyoxylase-like metal-dependent hydrolase (beta-lactamase superfamily II)
MSLAVNTWQRVPGSRSLEIFPIFAKPSIVSSNCFIVSAPAAILVIDPGASHQQTRQISDVVTAALAVSKRPVLLILTHCHQDHSQEADRLVLPAGTVLRRLAHDAAARALERNDRALTCNYLYPWNPPICNAPIHGRLFAVDGACEASELSLGRGNRLEIARRPASLDDGLAQRSIALGDGERLDIYHTPGHTSCSLSFQLGAVLMMGDLPFAANPGVCGLDGWNQEELMRTLPGVDRLLDNREVAICCPGHGHAVSAAAMRDQLRLMREEARDLTAVEAMNATRITGLKRYTDEFLEEASALFTILSGRLYAASYYLFDEGTDRLPVPLDLDGIDNTLTEFRRFDDAFRHSTTPELSVVIKGVQAARSLQQALARDDVQRLLEPSLVGRARRRLADFLGVVRGWQFLSAESPSRVNSVLAHLVARVESHADTDAAELLSLAGDRRRFLDVLTRRLAARSPFDQVTVDYVGACRQSEAGIAAQRLDDIVTSLIEGMAAAGARHIRLGTEVVNHQLLVRLSADIAGAAEALGQRRLALYQRTLGWLGASLECEQNAPTTFLLRLPELGQAVGARSVQRG